jgi:hypothetical protein
MKQNLLSDESAIELRIRQHPRFHELSRVVDSYAKDKNRLASFASFLLGLGKISSRARDIVFYINSKKPQSIREAEDLGKDYIYKA